MSGQDITFVQARADLISTMVPQLREYPATHATIKLTPAYRIALVNLIERGADVDGQVQLAKANRKLLKAMKRARWDTVVFEQQKNVAWSKAVCGLLILELLTTWLLS